MFSTLRKTSMRHIAIAIPARRSKSLFPFAAVTLSALVLSACGGGSDTDPSVDSAQGSSASDYRSFASVNPEVKAAIAAAPLATPPIAAKEADGSADRSAPAGDGDNGDDGETNDNLDSSSDDDSSSEDSSSDGASSSRVDTLITDMSEMNDHPLKNVNRKYGFSRGPGYVILGNNPRGANNLLPWFVQFEGEGNAARNTRIEMRNLNMFIKSRSSGNWKKVIDSDSYGGVQCDQGGNYYHCPEQAEVTKSDGSASTLLLSSLNLHGWWGGRVPIDNQDIAAVVVSLEARLIADRDRGVDDRAKAKYLLHVGADYYQSDSPPPEGIPPAAISRAKLVTNEWQMFSLTTLSDVGLQEPGGGITESELRSNPPPLD